jgi:hypothetical protein
VQARSLCSPLSACNISLDALVCVYMRVCARARMSPVLRPALVPSHRTVGRVDAGGASIFKGLPASVLTSFVDKVLGITVIINITQHLPCKN